jgi:Protein of unknown function (DUF3311)
VRRRRFAVAEAVMADESERRAWSWWSLLFLVQFVAVLWPPFYNRTDPTFIGLPFFYWYQLAVVIVSSILTAIVYFATESGRRRLTGA